MFAYNMNHQLNLEPDFVSTMGTQNSFSNNNFKIAGDTVALLPCPGTAWSGRLPSLDTVIVDCSPDFIAHYSP